MKKVRAAIICFYVGVLFVILGFIHKIWVFENLPLAPRTFIHFGTMWFIIAIFFVVNEILKELKQKSKE